MEWSLRWRRILPKGASETVHIVSVHARATPYPTGVYTGGRAKGADRPTRENYLTRYVLKPGSGDLAQALRHTNGTHAARFLRLDHR